MTMKYKPKVTLTRDHVEEILYRMGWNRKDSVIFWREAQKAATMDEAKKLLHSHVDAIIENIADSLLAIEYSRAAGCTEYELSKFREALENILHEMCVDASSARRLVEDIFAR
ncbi:MAG: hypothetical protein ACLP4V_22300 [Methylocella sp.]